jgi:hypothetical protein
MIPGPADSGPNRRAPKTGQTLPAHAVAGLATTHMQASGGGLHVTGQPGASRRPPRLRRRR